MSTMNVADQKAAEAFAAEQKEKELLNAVSEANNDANIVLGFASSRFIRNGCDPILTWEQVYNRIRNEDPDRLARALAVLVAHRCVEAMQAVDNLLSRLSGSAE